MGFRFEGISRWVRGLREGKVGVEVDGERGREEWEGIRGQVGRHSLVLSVCWDDWEGVREDGEEGEEKEKRESVRHRVARLMAR